MASCFDVANFFLSKADPDEGDVSNLKLQKLVYYAQGFALAILGEPLFHEPIFAWKHGPVVPDLYRAFREHGSSPIPPVPTDSLNGVFSSEQLSLLQDVFNVYGDISAWQLRNLSHATKPWDDAFPDGEISHGAMRSFFETLTV